MYLLKKQKDSFCPLIKCSANAGYAAISVVDFQNSRGSMLPDPLRWPSPYFNFISSYYAALGRTLDMNALNYVLYVYMSMVYVGSVQWKCEDRSKTYYNWSLYLYSVHGAGFNSVIKQESCGGFMLVMKKLSWIKFWYKNMSIYWTLWMRRKGKLDSLGIWLIGKNIFISLRLHCIFFLTQNLDFVAVLEKTLNNGEWFLASMKNVVKFSHWKLLKVMEKNQETLPEFQKVNRVGSIITVMHVFLGCNHQSYFLLTRDCKTWCF